MPKTLADVLAAIRSLAPIVFTTGSQSSPSGSTSTTLTPHQSILKQLAVMVVGEIEGTKTILLFARKHHKQVEIKSIERYRIENAIQDFGEDVEQHVYDGRDQVPPGKLTMGEVRKAIAAEAGKNPLHSGERLGRGIWEVNGRLVLCGSKNLATLNGHLEASEIPAAEGRVFKFSPEEEWFDVDQLESLLDKAKNPQWCKDVVDEAISLFKLWDNWTFPQSDPQLIAALVACTWLQTVWEWRPLVVVTGKTNTGKTFLLQNTIPYLFPRICLYCQKPSEAGLRQEIEGTARPVVIDEFEYDQQRQRIMELLRTSSRGGKILRGTAGQKSKAFGLKHIPWLGGIETGLNKAADRNRAIMFELKEIDHKPGRARLKLPPQADLEALGMKLLAVAMTNWKSVKALCSDVITQGVEGVDYRVVESYGLPCAFLGSVAGLTSAQTVELMRAMLTERQVNLSLVVSDEEKLLRDIYEAVVMLDRGGRATVSELLSGHYLAGDSGAAMNRVGIKQTYARKDRTKCVFFSPDPIKTNLLKGTKYEHVNIDEILSRIHGAFRGRLLLGVHWATGVSIPVDSIEKLIGGSKGDVLEETEVSSGDSGSSGGVF